MSYDLTIRSDNEFSARVPGARARALLAESPGFVAPAEEREPSSMVFEDPRTGESFVVYLEVVDPDGNSMESAGGGDQWNAIRVTIPYHCGEETAAGAFDLAFRVARGLGWRVYDEQEGSYLRLADLKQSHWGESRQTAQHVFESLGLRPAGGGSAAVGEAAEEASAEERRSRRWKFLLEFLVVLAFSGYLLHLVWPESWSAHELAERGDAAELQRLFRDDPDLVHERGLRGETPLHAAAKGGDLRAIGVCIEAGAELDATTPSGWTALHEACRRGHLGAVRILLEAGADREVRDKRDRTPLDVARGRSRRALADVFARVRR